MGGIPEAVSIASFLDASNRMLKMNSKVSLTDDSTEKESRPLLGSPFGSSFTYSHSFGGYHFLAGKDLGSYFLYLFLKN